MTDDTRIDYGMGKNGILAYTFIRTDVKKDVYVLICIKANDNIRTGYKTKEYKRLQSALKASRKFVHDTIFNSNNKSNDNK